MTSEEIRRALFKKRDKVTMTSIAKDCNVTRQMVSGVVSRKYVSRKIQKAIADALGHDLVYVWPELLGKIPHKNVSNFR